MPGQEHALADEHQTVLDMASASRTYPEAFRRLATIFASMRDPFHAISLLKEDKVLTPSELFLVAHLAYSAGRARAAMEEARDVPWPARVVPPSLRSIEKRLLPGSSGEPVFYVADSYSPELARLRADRKNKERAWRAEMAKEASEVERLLGRKIGLREEIAIRKSNPDVVDKARLMPELGETRETLTHVHFRLKAAREAVKLEREMSRLRQREASLEGDILATLSNELAPQAHRLEAAAWALGELDFLMCKADLAGEWGASKPEIWPEPACRLRIEGGFHPLVREEVEGRGGRYQPVTVDLDEPVTVITGPNMGGKTVALQTVGLCVALAQYGFPVPCSRMVFSLYDFIYLQPQTRGKPGLSSFAEEILSLRDLLSRKGERGVVLLDEAGRGTNPSQGLALYAALLFHLREEHNPLSTVIATTHYHGLAALVQAPHWQVAGLLDGASEDRTTGAGSCDIDWLYRHMDYRLQKVGPEAPTPQDALLVARLLGLDEDIIARASHLVRGGKVRTDATGF